MGRVRIMLRCGRAQQSLGQSARLLQSGSRERSAVDASAVQPVSGLQQA